MLRSEPLYAQFPSDVWVSAAASSCLTNPHCRRTYTAHRFPVLPALTINVPLHNGEAAQSVRLPPRYFVSFLYRECFPVQIPLLRQTVHRSVFSKPLTGPRPSTVHGFPAMPLPTQYEAVAPLLLIPEVLAIRGSDHPLPLGSPDNLTPALKPEDTSPVPLQVLLPDRCRTDLLLHRCFRL